MRLLLSSLTFTLFGLVSSVPIGPHHDSTGIASPPQYANYIVAGYINLPYAEIREQFTLYFDAKNNRSRVDYYDGMVKTMQFAGNPTSMVQINYVTTETVMNQLTCIQFNGSIDIPVFVQPGIPDLTGFAYMGPIEFQGHMADQWQMVQKVGTKTSTYTFTVDGQSGQPFRYEMNGVDSLFGSHFDRYIIEYTLYSAAQPPADAFNIPANLTCGGFPDSDATKYGSAEFMIQMNPMSEYIGGSSKHHDEMFEAFKRRHGKTYETDKEHAARKSVFAQNVRFIQSTNRAGKSYKVAVNHLADRTRDELKVLRGYRRSNKPNNAQPFNSFKHNLRGIKALPDSIDWRLYGAVTPVKDQAICGSCWSFGTTGTLEGTLFLKSGSLIRLSQQELMDCSWGEQNYGCMGGLDYQAYEWILKHGITSEEYYGPYLGQDGMCHVNNVSVVAKITGYVNVTQNDPMALKQAIAANGPVSVAMDASHDSFSFYSSGIYYEPQCGNGVDDLDHAVLAVGYGQINGQDYWLVKNSWSTYWGNDGYVLMSPKDNNCGIMTSPTFATM